MVREKILPFFLVISLIGLNIYSEMVHANVMNISSTTNDNFPTVPFILWNRTYGGTGADSCRGLVQTPDGGFALAGTTRSYGFRTPGMLLARTDLDGVLQWNSTYGGKYYINTHSFIQTSDGGFALAAQIDQQQNPFYTDIMLMKTDIYGIIQWNQSYGGKIDDNVHALIKTDDGGFALAGGTHLLADEVYYDMWFIKTDENGVIQWNATYGGNFSSYIYSLIQTVDGGFALAGGTTSFGTDNTDIWLIKTDVNGNVRWNQTYGKSTTQDYVFALIQTADGGFALAGWTRLTEYVETDFYLVKTDMNGLLEWTQTYGGNSSDAAYSLLQSADDGFLLVGSTRSFGQGNSDIWLIKTDVHGNVHWNQTYGGTDHDYGYSLIKTYDGGLAIAGSTKSFGTGSRDMWLIVLTISNPATSNFLEFLLVIVIDLVPMGLFVGIVIALVLLQKRGKKES